MEAIMDQSILRLPDPVAGSPNRERRRSVRQKLHTPVYASFNGPQTGMVVDLSELLDLHEEGFAVRTSERLETNHAITLCLDLPETKSYIHGSGQVVWSDDTGRGGIRFSGLSESSRQVLRQWLFANLLIACSNHAARTEQLTQRKNDNDKDGEKLAQPVLVSETPKVVPIVSPVETGLAPSQTRQAESLQVETVRRELREIGDDVGAILQHVTERALLFTGASGAALALLTDGKMVCRARAGEPAPQLGAPVDAKQGLSGECVRNGLLVSCEDTENDPRIDPEIGHALGIGSLMAAPIVSDFRVVGLLEIFFPHPRGFTKAHQTILDRLVEMIPKTHREKTQPEKTQPATPIGPEAVSGVSRPPASESGSMESGSIHATREALWEQKPEEQASQRVPGQMVAAQVPEQIPEQIPKPPAAAPSRLLDLGLLGLAIAVVAMVVGYLVGPMIEKRISPDASQRSVPEAASKVSGQSATDQRSADQRSADQRPPAKSLADL